MRDLLTKHRHEQIPRDYAGVEVYHLPGLTAYLKIGEVAQNSYLKYECDALNWLAGKFAVPKVIDFEQNGGTESLLISAIAGTPASEYVSSAKTSSNHIEEFIKTAARSMRQLHSIPIDDCPLDQRLDTKLMIALENIRSGGVDESDFDEERIGKTAVEIYDELRDQQPADEDLVFTHGDFCLPNIIVGGGAITGLVDLGRAGVADRYQDIALFLRSFKFNSAAEMNVERIFCDAHGIDSLNRTKLDFYRKLDELF